MNRIYWWAGAAIAVLVLAFAAGNSTGAARRPAAQTEEKKTAPADSEEAVLRGKATFRKQCSACHYPASDAKKVGPGLKGLNKRGTFTVNGNKVTDDSLKTWIENGDSSMPSFKDTLTADQLRDVIRYVRTL